MKRISDCTLMVADTYNYGGAVASLKKCMQQCEFERVIFFTNIPIKVDGIEVIQIEDLKHKDGYSHFILKEAWKHITTEFVLVVQHDSWILDGEQFDERLYEVDYAGALWPEQDGLTNGNGGFSWRSYKLMEAAANDDIVKGTAPEDVSLCRVYRRHLENVYHLVWASDEICERFSFELKEPSQKTFGFHGNFHQPFSPSIILKRSAAIGDCIILEPVMRHFSAKGYNVVLDIPIAYFPLYNQHYFPVKHISQFDRGRIEPAREINLDLAYEVKPRQSYLQSYFEFCGIEDFKLSRPVLYPLVNEVTKPYKRYCIIHIDKRETAYRNIYDVDWKKVERHLAALDCTVIQIGSNEHEGVGIEYNTMGNLGLLKFLIGGCDMFIGVDSGPAHIAVAYNKPCVLFFGSVNPNYIHPDLTNVEVIQGNCDRSYCWHIVGGQSGQECFYKGTEKHLQCCKASWETVVDAINKLVQQNAPRSQ